MELVTVKVSDYIEANKLRLIQIDEFIPLYEKEAKAVSFFNFSEKRIINERINELRLEKRDRESVVFLLSLYKVEKMMISLKKYSFLTQYVKLKG